MPAMASKRDYYEVLSVTRSATVVEIKKAYKKLALANHPDRNPGDDEAVSRFKEAAEAYEVLSDDDKRSRYDRFGHAGVQGASRGGGGGFHDVGDIFEQFSDIFEGFGFNFGGGRGRSGRGRGPRRGNHLRTSVSITLQEAALGIEKEISIDRTKTCETCEGSGAEPGTTPQTCDYCGGAGQVVQAQGFFRVQTTCPACRGAGQMIREKCPTCDGSGREADHLTEKVKIPAGVDNGMQLCLRGRGRPGQKGGPRGDLLSTSRSKRTTLRAGRHTPDVPGADFVHSGDVGGDTVEVPLCMGRRRLRSPPGRNRARSSVCEAKAMPDPHGGRAGDLHVEIQLEVPKKLEPDHEKLLRKLAEHEKTQVSPHKKSWFDKLKELVTGDEE